MQVQAVNQYTQNSQTNFKSVYPVHHWVSDMGSKYSESITNELKECLNRKIVGYANRKTPAKNKAINELAIRVQRFLMRNDRSFGRNLNSRSYYSDGAYLITGDDVAIFENNFAKNIGKAKALSNDSAELNIALGDYYTKGLNFVKENCKKFVDAKGQQYALHTKFDVIRTKTGNVKEYKLVDMKFLPIGDLEECATKINAK